MTNKMIFILYFSKQESKSKIQTFFIYSKQVPFIIKQKLKNTSQNEKKTSRCIHLKARAWTQSTVHSMKLLCRLQVLLPFHRSGVQMMQLQ